MFGSVSRRELLAGGAAAALAVMAGAPDARSAVASANPTLDGFMALSGRLAGHAPLDATMGKNILDGFIAAGRGAEIAALIADAPQQNSTSKSADAIVAAWYSGLSPAPGARTVTGFNEALVWDALTYTKPWGSCGGETGYWADPPANDGP